MDSAYKVQPMMHKHDHDASHPMVLVTASNDLQGHSDNTVNHGNHILSSTYEMRERHNSEGGGAGNLNNNYNGSVAWSFGADSNYLKITESSISNKNMKRTTTRRFSASKPWTQSDAARTIIKSYPRPGDVFDITRRSMQIDDFQLEMNNDPMESSVTEGEEEQDLLSQKSVGNNLLTSSIKSNGVNIVVGTDLRNVGTISSIIDSGDHLQHQRDAPIAQNGYLGDDLPATTLGRLAISELRDEYPPPMLQSSVIIQRHGEQIVIPQKKVSGGFLNLQKKYRSLLDAFQTLSAELAEQSKEFTAGVQAEIEEETVKLDSLKMQVAKAQEELWEQNEEKTRLSEEVNRLLTNREMIVEDISRLELEKQVIAAEILKSRHQSVQGAQIMEGNQVLQKEGGDGSNDCGDNCDDNAKEEGIESDHGEENGMALLKASDSEEEDEEVGVQVVLETEYNGEAEEEEKVVMVMTVPGLEEQLSTQNGQERSSENREKEIEMQSNDVNLPAINGINHQESAVIIDGNKGVFANTAPAMTTIRHALGGQRNERFEDYVSLSHMHHRRSSSCAVAEKTASGIGMMTTTAEKTFGSKREVVDCYGSTLSPVRQNPRKNSHNLDRLQSLSEYLRSKAQRIGGVSPVKLVPFEEIYTEQDQTEEHDNSVSSIDAVQEKSNSLIPQPINTEQLRRQSDTFVGITNESISKEITDFSNSSSNNTSNNISQQDATQLQQQVKGFYANLIYPQHASQYYLQVDQRELYHKGTSATQHSAAKQQIVPFNHAQFELITASLSTEKLRRFKKACLHSEKAVLYDDSEIKIGLTSKSAVTDDSKPFVRFQVYIFNKSACYDIASFNLDFIQNSDLSIWTKPQKLQGRIPANGLLRQEIVVALNQIPFEFLQIRFSIVRSDLNNRESRETLALPVTLNRFMEFTQAQLLSVEAFKSNWGSTNPLLKFTSDVFEHSLKSTWMITSTYFPNLIELTKETRDEHLAGLCDALFAGAFTMFGIPMLVMCTMKPRNQMAISIALRDMNNYQHYTLTLLTQLLQNLQFLLQAAPDMHQ